MILSSCGCKVSWALRGGVRLLREPRRLFRLTGDTHSLIIRCDRRPLRNRVCSNSAAHGPGKSTGFSRPQRVEKVRLRRPFPNFYAVSLSPPRGSRAGNSAKKPCTARLPNPPHMSPDSDCIWRALALQTSRNGFLTVWGRENPPDSPGLSHLQICGFSDGYGGCGRCAAGQFTLSASHRSVSRSCICQQRED